jgi:hypothetical protein
MEGSPEKADRGRMVPLKSGETIKGLSALPSGGKDKPRSDPSNAGHGASFGVWNRNPGGTMPLTMVSAWTPPALVR